MSNPGHTGLDEHRVVHLKKWIGHFEVLTALAFCFCCAVPYFFQHDLVERSVNGTSRADGPDEPVIKVFLNTLHPGQAGLSGEKG